MNHYVIRTLDDKLEYITLEISAIEPQTAVDMAREMMRKRGIIADIISVSVKVLNWN